MSFLSLASNYFDRSEPLGDHWEDLKSIFPSPSLASSLISFLTWGKAFHYYWSYSQSSQTHWIFAQYGNYVYCPILPTPLTFDALQLAFQFMEKMNGPGPGISRIEGLTENQKPQIMGWGYNVRPVFFEYLYPTTQLAALKGNHYRSRRAEKNHLEKNHNLLFRPFLKSDLNACKTLWSNWYQQKIQRQSHPQAVQMMQSAQWAHELALDHIEDWGLHAWVVWVNQHLSAYLIGSPLSSNTFGIYFEITDLTLKGLSTYIFVNVCNRILDFPFVNTGDAEFLETLAYAKQTWHPCQKLFVYAIDPSIVRP